MSLKDITISEIYNKSYPFAGLVAGTGIVLIGDAIQGPSLVPVKINTEDKISNIFGYESQLTNAYRECFVNGVSEIYVVRLNGIHRTINVQGMLELTTVSADNTTNATNYQVIGSGNDRFLYIYNDITNSQQQYRLNDKTIFELVSEINTNALGGISPVYATSTSDFSAMSLYNTSNSDLSLSEIEDLTREEYFVRLREVLSMLSGYSIQQVGLLSAQYNEIVADECVYQILCDFANEKAQVCEPCIITVGANINALTSNTTLYNESIDFVKKLKTTYQVSEYINVVIARPIYGFTSSYYTSNGVATYCSLINNMTVQSSTTNMIIPNASDEQSGLTDLQKNDLADNGYVVYVAGTKNGVYQVRVLKGVNLTRRVRDVINIVVGEGTSVRAIPTLASNIANIKFIQELAVKLHTLFDKDNEIGDISDLRVSTDNIIQEFSNIIRNYAIDITQTHLGYTKYYVIKIDVVPVGEVESISLAVRLQ